MKNKISYLLFALIANLYFVQPAYCQPLTHNDCYSESLTEVIPTEIDTNVRDAYRYASVGVGPIIFIPNVGIGYRERFSRFGWDTGLSYSTLGYVHQVSGHMVGHYYLSRTCKNSAYLGLGLIGSGIFTNHKESAGTLSTDFVFGKELAGNASSKHFIEMHVGIPSLWIEKNHTNSFYLPLMYIKYGMAF